MKNENKKFREWENEKNYWQNIVRQSDFLLQERHYKKGNGDFLLGISQYKRDSTNVHTLEKKFISEGKRKEYWEGRK